MCVPKGVNQRGKTSEICSFIGRSGNPVIASKPRLMFKMAHSFPGFLKMNRKFRQHSNPPLLRLASFLVLSYMTIYMLILFWRI